MEGLMCSIGLPQGRHWKDREKKCFFFFFVQTIKTEARLNAGTYTIFIFSLYYYYFFLEPICRYTLPL